MSVSGWLAVGCWAVILVGVLWGLVRALRDRRRLRRDLVWEPEPPEFRDWLDDWDEVWP